MFYHYHELPLLGGEGKHTVNNGMKKIEFITLYTFQMQNESLLAIGKWAGHQGSALGNRKNKIQKANVKNKDKNGFYKNADQ